MRIAIFTTMLLLAASVACANPGINLYYNDCSAGGATALTDACSANTGPAMTLVASAILPQVTRTQFCGAEALIDVWFDGNVIPDWWRIASADPLIPADNPCRSAAMTFTADASVSPGCPTLWDSHGDIGSAFTVHANVLAPGTVRLWGAAVVPATEAFDLVGDGATELGLFKFTINHRQTTGAGACGGCATRASIVLTEINLVTLADTPLTILHLTVPAQNNIVTWQGGVPVVDHTTATHNRTWGAIKAMYR